jgi:hypothetical protein
MLSYPYSYGDELSNETAKKRQVNFVKSVVVGTVLFTGTAAASYAVEKIAPPEKQKSIIAPSRKTTKSLLSGATCTVAGIACLDPTSKAAIIACGFFAGWCCARHSPI